MTIEEAREIIRKTKSPYLKRDMEKFIKRTQKKEPNELIRIYGQEKTEETTTVFYQKDAAGLLRSLYGIME